MRTLMCAFLISVMLPFSCEAGVLWGDNVRITYYGDAPRAPSAVIYSSVPVYASARPRVKLRRAARYSAKAAKYSAKAAVYSGN